MSELKENDSVTFVTALTVSTFAYALSNGTVGVYNNKDQRLWRIKSKKQIVSLTGHDVDNDGENELVCAWSNGKLDVRHWASGHVIFKDTVPAGIASVASADWLQRGFNQLVVCSLQGQRNFCISMCHQSNTESAPCCPRSSENLHGR